MQKIIRYFNQSNQPPDLDEFFKGLLNRKKDDSKQQNQLQEPNNNNEPNKIKPSGEKKFFSAAISLGLIVWLASGIYTVKERENGIELFLGKYSNTTKSGLNWNYPYPIGRVEKVDIQTINTMRIGEFKTQKGVISTQDQRVGQMLTKDENIVEIGAAVQYRISDARAFQFNAAEPVMVLQDVVTSAIREVVGANTVDDVLTDRRNEWPAQARQIIVDTVKAYGLGIEIVALELQDARVPVEVQDAFEDAVKAREDEERLRLQAEAFANERLPIARGNAQKIIQAANAYAVAVVAKANAEASRFNDLLAAYNKNKEAMRERLYIDNMAAVYQSNKKILLDGNATPIINLDNAVATAAKPEIVAATVKQNNEGSGVRLNNAEENNPEIPSNSYRSRTRNRR